MNGARSVPGLLAVDTIGHTPGHTSYILSSGSDKVFIQSTLTNHPRCLWSIRAGTLHDQDAAQRDHAAQGL